MPVGSVDLGDDNKIVANGIENNLEEEIKGGVRQSFSYRNSKSRRIQSEIKKKKNKSSIHNK